VSKRARREIGEYLATYLDGLPAPLTFDQVDEITDCLSQSRAVLDPVNHDRLSHAQQLDAIDCLDITLSAYEAMHWRTVAVEMILTGTEPFTAPDLNARVTIALGLLAGHVRFDRSIVDEQIARLRHPAGKDT
jgi:hypothetical protein